MLASKHPADRMSLLSSQQDQTIRSYLTLSAADFQTAVTRLDTDRLEPTARTRVFYVPGSSHTMFGSLAGFSQNGVALTTFLQQQISGDAAWKSQKP